jgi:hypothetical protein
MIYEWFISTEVVTEGGGRWRGTKWGEEQLGPRLRYTMFTSSMPRLKAKPPKGAPIELAIIMGDTSAVDREGSAFRGFRRPSLAVVRRTYFAPHGEDGGSSSSRNEAATTLGELNYLEAEISRAEKTEALAPVGVVDAPDLP